MAKLLKQIVIFCAFTAIIYGVFTFVTAGKKGLSTTDLIGSNVDELSNEITNDWANVNDWDNDIYTRHMTMVAQCHNSELINDDARKSLYDRVNKEAYTTAIAAMNREFACVDADESALSLNEDGLMTVASREPGIERIPEVAEVERIYGVYRRVKQFNNRSFNLTPRFNGDDCSWSPSFPSMAANARATRDQLLNNTDFKSRLSHINEMKKIHETESKLERSRRAYYNSLADQIESYFSSIQTEEGSDERKALRMKFQTVRSAVFNETNGNHEINSRLKNYLQRL